VEGLDDRHEARLVLQLCLQHSVLLKDRRQPVIPGVEADRLGAKVIVAKGVDRLLNRLASGRRQSRLAVAQDGGGQHGDHGR